MRSTLIILIYCMQEMPCHLVKSHNTMHLCFYIIRSSVTISDMDAIATVMTSFTAILILNMQDISKLINVKVHISTFNCTMYQYNRSVRNSGIVIYYSDQDRIAKRIKLTINNFYYNNTAYKSCINHFHCVITILFLESGKKNKNFALDLEICIQNSVFSNLKNSSILCYYGEAYNDKKYDDIHTRSVIITNSTISNNTGHHQLSMFYIVLKSLSRISTLFLLRRYEKKRLYNIFIFQGGVFANNSDMKAVIYVKPPTTDAIVGHILINNSTFQKNINTNFITVKKEDQTLWYVTTYFRLYYVNIFSNKPSDGDSLLLVTSGIISLLHVNFNHNTYFGNVISLRSSMLLFRNYTNITNNYARHIVMAQSKSFLFINVFTTINISHNFVYKTIIQLSTFEKNALPICPLQSHRCLNYKNLKLNEVKCKLLLLQNTEMISKNFTTEILSYASKNCTWLQDSIFQKLNVNVNTMYDKIIKCNNKFANKSNITRVIPLSVCPCLNNSSYNCSVAHLYSIFPGQVL